MESKKNRAAFLADKFLSKSSTPEEELEFHVWYQKELHKPVVFPADFVGSEEEHRQRILKAIESNIDRPVRRIWPRFAAAASLILIMGAGLFYYNLKTSEKNPVELSNYGGDVAPGIQGATLTLANGKQIKLSGAVNGELAKEAGVVITKSANGQLVYTVSASLDGAPSDGVVQKNILSTAKGESYEVHLPDGSLVALNAASSLEYPASFTKLKDRRVKLTGEGYFQVAKDKSHPFIVETDKQMVEVLGTHFNINSYADESEIKTTLLEGSIRLNKETLLKPGEQSTLNKSGKISVEQVDVDNAIAWKNGYFQFEGETLESIMRKVSRWYDVEVTFQKESLKEMAFVGTVSKYKSVSQILKKLQMTNELDFKITGKKILISAHKM